MTSLFHPAYADTGYARFRFRRVLRALWSLLMHHYDRYLQRLDLAALDAWQLTDLGLTPEDVRRECAKSLWRLWPHRQCNPISQPMFRR
ncbi:MAG TPA: DUF1127 domain-containing protein [Mesorhizobium sp.]|jgi:uncharacterized protein YjiS (DUF1127 family)|uniref:DUF1127 domain-containing protein n=1 Tax=Mesorhizobium sp. TaxID=1871066 RepID=UPI002DDC9A9F|nr:DUF1127 domain-containing protein [Mesorhizobium sp.]HEV2502919.1 DUF1127 domain-containing protein [Mesorhizobium sp.]